MNFIVVTGIEMPCRLVPPNFWLSPTLQIQEDKLREVAAASVLHKPDHDWMVNRAQQLFTEYGSGWNLCRGHDLSKLLALNLNALE